MAVFAGRGYLSAPSDGGTKNGVDPCGCRTSGSGTRGHRLPRFLIFDVRLLSSSAPPSVRFPAPPDPPFPLPAPGTNHPPLPDDLQPRVLRRPGPDREVGVLSMRAFALGLLLIAYASETRASAPKFPYDAVVQADDVEVRSGPGTHYYATGVLKKSDTVTVHRHDPGGWFMVSRPRGASATSTPASSSGKGTGASSRSSRTRTARSPGDRPHRQPARRRPQVLWPPAHERRPGPGPR